MIPRLHVVVPPEAAAREDFGALAGEMLRTGGPRIALQLRLPGAPGRRLYELARELSSRAVEAGGWCVVNGRADVAAAAGAQAVQLGRRAMPPGAVRRAFGEGFALGASVHGPEEARAAAASGANFLVVGTIFPSRSHPGFEGGGPGLLEACRSAGLPMVAIGGVRAERVGRLLGAGAHGVAAVSAVWGAEDPVAAAAELLASLPGTG